MVLTADQVRGLWAHMAKRYRARVIHKATAAEMLVLSRFLDRIGVADEQDFMRRFATTIGRWIYVPFTPGERTQTWSLLEQAVVCVHECHHIHQYDKFGPFLFGWQYVMSTARRTLLEVEAYRCNMEMHWALERRLVPPEQLAAHLRAYGVTDEDVRNAERMLRSASRTVQQGGIASPASRDALAYLL